MAAREPLRDEVDEIVAAWWRERPDLDTAPLEIGSRITRLARHLDRQRAGAFGGHGLESWQFDVLAALRRSGAPYQLTPGQLMRETMVASGTMTNRVDRLEVSGLVEREEHPGDRRGVLVRLTLRGREAVDAALADLLVAERRVFSALSADEQTALIQALRGLLASYRR